MLDFFKGTVTKQDWIFCGVVLTVAVALAAVYFSVVLRMQSTALESAQASLAQQKKKLEEQVSWKNNIDKLRDQTAKAQKIAEGFEQRLPTESNITQFIGSVGDALRAAGVSLSGNKGGLQSLPKGKTETGNLVIYPYRVSVLGDFHQILTLINLLEKDTRFFKVSDIDIGEEKNGVIEGKFNLSTYSFKQKPPELEAGEANAAAKDATKSEKPGAAAAK